MNFNRKWLFLLIAGMTAAMLSGCVISEESISPDTSRPTAQTGTDRDSDLPFVQTAPTGVRQEGTSIKDKFRMLVVFNEDMNDNTVNTTNFKLRNMTDGTPVDMTGYTVSYSAIEKTAYIEYTNTGSIGATGGTPDITAIELVISKSVTDLAGNGLAGIRGLVGGANDDKTVADYHKVIGTPKTGFTPSYAPATVNNFTLTTTGGTADTATIIGTLDLNFSIPYAGTLDANSVTANDFTFSPDIKSTCTFSFNGSRARFGSCTTAANTVYKVTYVPSANFKLTLSYAGTMDSITNLIEKTQIFDTFSLGNDPDSGFSDYVYVFQTRNENNWTGAGNLIYLRVTASSGKSTQTVRLTFNKIMELATVTNPTHYIVSIATGAISLDSARDFKPVYTYDGTADAMVIYSVDISTAKSVQQNITQVKVKSSITSQDGKPLDQNNDGILQGDKDLDGDSIPDDWFIY